MRLHITDDTGQRRLFQLDNAFYLADDPVRADAARHFSRFVMLTTMPPMRLIALLGGLMGAVFVFSRQWGVSINPILMGAGMGLGLGGVLYVMRQRERTAPRAANDQLIARVVSQGICAACGYDLAGLTPTGDGHVVCPECGSVWRADRFDRTEALPPLPHPSSGRGGAVAGVRGSASTLRLWWRAVRRTDETGLEARWSRDDHAQRVPLVSLSRLRADARRAGERSSQLADAYAELRRIGRTARVILAGFYIVLGAGMIVLALMMRIGWHTVLAPLGALAVLLAARQLLRSSVGVPPTAVRRVLLAHARCPSCAGDLSGVEADGERIMECPRCSAAWRAPRQARSA